MTGLSQTFKRGDEVFNALTTAVTEAEAQIEASRKADM